MPAIELQPRIRYSSTTATATWTGTAAICGHCQIERTRYESEGRDSVATYQKMEICADFGNLERIHCHQVDDCPSIGLAAVLAVRVGLVSLARA